MDFSGVIASWRIYFEGLILTVELVGLSVLLGSCLAVPVALMRVSRIVLLNWPAWAYTYVMRGTPLLVQLYIIYYGFAQFEVVRESWAWVFLRSPWWCALIAFTLNTAGYTAEILRGGIETTPKGQIEAAQAYGMGRLAVFRHIVLPGAFRRALPAYSNEVIFLLHGSAIASTVTLIDILGAAQVVNTNFFTPYAAFITAALIYMAITFTLIFLFQRLERRLLRHLKRNTS